MHKATQAEFWGGEVSMFGRAKRIKELENEIVELKAEKLRYHRKIDELSKENARLRMSLEPFKPVLENPKLKPAITPFCELCDYRVMSGSNVVGCCKDSVCDDFERRGVGNDH